MSTATKNTTATEPYVMNKKLGFIAMLISATGMGMVGFFSRGATGGIDPEIKQYLGSFLAFGRMTVGLIGFLIILLVTKRFYAFRQSRLSFAVIAGGVCIGTSLALYITSTLLTSIANAVFLIYTGPLFCTLLARIFRKEKISALNALFLTLVFLGMLFTIEFVKMTPEGIQFGIDLSASTPDFPQKALGDLVGLLSGVFYGLALFFYGYRQDMDSDVRGTWNFLWAAVATGIMSLVMRPQISALSTTNWTWAAGLFFFCGLIALGFLVVAGRNLPAVEMSCISYWECVVALFFGVFFFKEAMTFFAAIGGLLIIAGGVGPIIVDLLNKARRRDAGAHTIEEGDPIR
ncbi:EamA family transporter [Bowdeniella nasicola]|uniref:EamA family transporter n=2 Tax=Bowdeniella nasicola TaxID=208480 RepID=A0A1Q5Q2V4_9ACTO|nr:EamA family transporter [Bowdeniella nasicola]